MSLLPHRHGPRSGQRPLLHTPNSYPPPHATHTSRHAPRSTTRPSPSTQSTSLTPRTTHATHPYPPNPETTKNPEAPSPSTTPNARYYLPQEPRHTPTDRNRSTIHAPQHDPLRHAHEQAPPEAPSTSSTTTRAPHSHVRTQPQKRTHRTPLPHLHQTPQLQVQHPT